MKTVEFNKAGIGKWAESDTLLPQFEIEEAGQTHLCSNELAAIIAGVDKGKIIDTEDSAAPEDSEEKEQLKSEAIQLITDLGLDINDHNLGLDIEGLRGTVKNLSTMKADKEAEAEAAAEAAAAAEAEAKAKAEAEKKPRAKKNPATTDKKKSESK